MDIEKLFKYTEKIASKVHDAWWEEKKRQGFHPPNECLKKSKEDKLGKAYKFAKSCDKCHSDMYPYEELPEHIKEYDRVTVKTVLGAIKQIKMNNQGASQACSSGNIAS